jgi:hypothetical protein
MPVCLKNAGSPAEDQAGTGKEKLLRPVHPLKRSGSETVSFRLQEAIVNYYI